MSDKLKDHVAAVTGATHDIGKVIAGRLAGGGAGVVALDSKANVVAFLASHDPRWMLGRTVNVDAGTARC